MMEKKTGMKNKPIGIFDSGLGGLTVVQEVWNLLPAEQILYFGDTARVPYGGRSETEIIEFNRQIIDFLVHEGAKAIIFACNTSTALALSKMREQFAVPMFGIIKPGAKAAVAVTHNKRIGLLATQATVNSGAYREAIVALNPEVTLFEQASPKLVPLIEDGLVDMCAVQGALKEYLTPLSQLEVDTLIYGCTHYPFLQAQVERLFPGQFSHINPARSCVLEVKEYLAQNKLFSEQKNGTDRYFVSGEPGKFGLIGSRLIGQVLPTPGKVDIESWG